MRTHYMAEWFKGTWRPHPCDGMAKHLVIKIRFFCNNVKSTKKLMARARYVCYQITRIMLF